jgi:hypothetical protein
MRTSLPLLFPLVLVACGGASNAALFEEPAGGADASTTDGATPGADTGSPAADTGAPAADTGSAVPDSGTDTAPPPSVTLDTVCPKVADAYCTGTLESCCKTEGLAWNEAGCRAAISAVCDARVKAVKEGKATFNPAALSQCANAWKSMTGRCELPVLDYVKNQAFCSQLFVGTVPPAGACTESSQCKVAVGAVPDCSMSRCQTTTVSDKDQPCAYTGAVRAFCDYGLACQFSSGATGTCKAAKGVGASCSSSLECGFGFICDRPGLGGSGKCAAGDPAGSPCFSGDRCASGQCLSGRCTDTNVAVVSSFLCSGT